MLLCLSALALAQADEPIPEHYRPITIIDVAEGLDVQAPVLGPEGAYLAEVARPVFNPLIRLRLNFADEMAASVNAVK